MEAPRLDWSSAEVHDGTLNVPIAGEQPEGWSDAFERTVTLLRSGRWEEISLKDDQVSVGGVGEGDEDSLHHFLESAVQEANALTTRDDEDGGEEQDEDADDEDDAGDDEDDTDTRMTDRFRDLSSDES